MAAAMEGSTTKNQCDETDICYIQLLYSLQVRQSHGIPAAASRGTASDDTHRLILVANVLSIIQL